MELSVCKVFPSAQFRAGARLFACLSELFSVRFQPVDSLPYDRSPVIVIGMAPPRRLPGPAFLAVAGWNSSHAHPGPAAELSFSSSPSVPWPFRNIRLRDGRLGPVCPVNVERSTPLAAVDRACVWAEDCSASQTFWCGVPLPVLSPDEFLCHWFSPESWAGLLPLLEWLRRVGPVTWTPPAPHAAIIVDDPNLHRVRYGKIDYSVLSQHARRHNYHAAIATIPLDSWYAHPAAVAAFHTHPQHLSLLVHGNNHVVHEFAQNIDPRHKRAAVAQSLRRIEAFERRTGLRVARVMTAPHGACDMDSAAAIYAFGYDAACISVGSLLYWNRGRTWPLSLGMLPADRLPAGLPVIHRFPCDHARTLALQVRLSAYLGHPLVFTTHHQDFGARVETVANAVNALGPVTWTNMAEIARSCYATYLSPKRLTVRLFTAGARVPIPDGIEEMTIDSGIADPTTLKVEDLIAGPVSDGSLCATLAERRLHIRIAREPAEDFRTEPAPPFSPWALLRRTLCEGRDQLFSRPARPLLRI